MQQKNSKTPLVFRVSLVLLCALVISTYMISGLYARFIITATRLGRVNVAKIDYSVNYEFSGYGSLGDVDGDNNDVYAIMEAFSVENTGDVTYTYDLSLVLSKDIASASYESPAEQANFHLGIPIGKTGVKYVHHPSSDSTQGQVRDATASELTGLGSFEAGKAYYAYSADGINYTWVEATLNGKYLSVHSPSGLAPGQQYYYKIIYFIHMTASTTLPQQQMTLFYSITCEQIN